MTSAAARIIVMLIALAAVAGCASTKVTDQSPMVPGIARPNQILVYDFVASPKDMSADAAIGSAVFAPSSPLTPEQIANGRRLGSLIAKQLAADIQAMGLTAVQPGGTNRRRDSQNLWRGDRQKCA
jgi:hypothetical protein